MLKRIANFFIDPVLRSSWRSIILLWKPMAFWTLIVYAIFTALLAPLVVALINWGVFRGDRLIVGNEELLSWLLSTTGLFYLFGIVLVALTGIVVRFTGLFQIITADLKGDPISVKNIALHIAQRIHILIKLCAFTLFSAILLLLPLAAGLFLCYHVWLSEFDINYYLTITPPEWYRALTFGGIWFGLWLIGLITLVAWSLPALPAYLDGKRTIRQSILEAWSMPIPQMLRFLKIIFVVVGIWFFCRFMNDVLFLAAFGFIVDALHSRFESLRLIAFITGGYLFFTLTVGAIISFIGFSLTSAIITKFYYKDSARNVNIVIPGFQKLVQKTISVFTWWLTPLRIALLVVIILTGSFTASYFLIGNQPGQDRVEIISHRANALGAPENSLIALENSITVGAGYAEIDVQLTADSIPVVLHDADLMRVAGDPRRISDVTYDEISDLRLITNDDSIANQMLIIPTLSDYLELAQNRIGLMIELKYYGFDPLLAEETVRTIRQHQMEEQVVLMSLSLNAIRQIRDIAPDLTLGYVSAVAAGDPARLPIDFIAINQQNVTPQLINTFRAQNKRVYSWTVNRPGDMVESIEKGVDGLITDEPLLAISIVEEMAQLTRAERILLQFGFLIIEGQSALQEAL